MGFTNGGTVLNDSVDPLRDQQPCGGEACNFARSLVAKKLAPSPGGTFNQFSALGQGYLAMMGAGIWPWNYYVENGGRQRICHCPLAEESPAGLAGRPRRLPDPRRHRRSKDEAWEFVKYSISESFQANEAVPIEGGMPMRISIANSKSFLKTLPPGAEYFTAALVTPTRL